MTRKIKRIGLHGSKSPFGNSYLINKWHVQKGYDCIGYNYTVLNQYPHTTLIAEPYMDGMIESGRDPRKIPAHAYGYNSTSLGVCLIGALGVYTLMQYISSAALIRALLKEYHLTVNDVYGHYEIRSPKLEPTICPGIDMGLYREYLETGYTDPLTKMSQGVTL